MNESLREILYPLGFLAALAFGLRFLLQWITSEIEKKSVVSKGFWRLSLAGNLMLLVHSLVQSQFHVCVVQACNAIISWRNLNLMEPVANRVSFKAVIKMLVGAVVSVLFFFIIMSSIEGTSAIEWFRLPNPGAEQIGLFWHLLGCVGLVLFSLRFWIQWWYAEKYHVSALSLPFWWLSLVGGALSVIYFIQIADPVNVIGPAVGLIPYARNLILMQQKSPVQANG